MDVPKEKIELSLTSDIYPDVDSLVDVTVEGRKQACDLVFDVLIQKFNVLNQKIGGEEKNE